MWHVRNDRNWAALAETVEERNFGTLIMSTVAARFPIHPKQAVEKFLVDMRLTAERAFRRWNKVLMEAISDCPLSPNERAALLKPHPIDDYFYAGVVALHAQTVRQLFPSDIAEGLMKELAIQADPSVGRTDSVVSHIIFMALSRMRKAREANNERDHDQVVETLLERIGVDRRKATQHLMTQLLLRQTLCEPLVMAGPNWWQGFAQLYSVMKPPRVISPVRQVTVIDPATTTPVRRRQDAPAPLAARTLDGGLPPHILEALTSRPKRDHLRQ